MESKTYLKERKGLDEDEPEELEEKNLEQPQDDFIMDDKPQKRELGVTVTNDFTPGEFSAYDRDGFFNSSIRLIDQAEQGDVIEGKRGKIIIESQTLEESRGQRIYLACIRMNPKDFDYTGITNRDVDLMIMAYDYLHDSRPFYNLYEYLIDNCSNGSQDSPKLKVDEGRMLILSLGKYNKVFESCLPLMYLPISEEEKRNTTISDLQLQRRVIDQLVEKEISNYIKSLDRIQENVFLNGSNYTSAEIKFIFERFRGSIKDKGTITSFILACRYNHSYCLDQIMTQGPISQSLYDGFKESLNRNAEDSIKWFFNKFREAQENKEPQDNPFIDLSSPQSLRAHLRECSEHPSLIKRMLEEIRKTPDVLFGYYFDAMLECCRKGYKEGLDTLISESKEVTIVSLRILLIEATWFSNTINIEGVVGLLLKHIREKIEKRETKEMSTSNIYYKALESSSGGPGREQIFIMILNDAFKHPDGSFEDEEIDEISNNLISREFYDGIDLMIKNDLIGRSLYVKLMKKILETKHMDMMTKLTKYFKESKVQDKDTLSEIFTYYIGKDSNVDDMRAIIDLFDLDKSEHFTEALEHAIIVSPDMVVPIIRIGKLNEDQVFNVLNITVENPTIDPQSVRNLIKEKVITDVEIYESIKSEMEYSGIEDENRLELITILSDEIERLRKEE